MHAFKLAIGAHFLGTRCRIIPLVDIVVAFSNPMIEILIGFNEGSHRCIQFSVGSSEVIIDLDQFLQYPLLSGGSRRGGVKIFVKVVIRLGQIIGLLGGRRILLRLL